MKNLLNINQIKKWATTEHEIINGILGVNNIRFGLDKKDSKGIFSEEKIIALIKENCRLKGIEINDLSANRDITDVIEEVGRFWAKPSSNPLTPPPHSTGSAIDLTLADMSGNPLDLGGEIDFIGAESTPDFYKKDYSMMPCSKHQVFQKRRSLLYSVM